MHLYINGTAFLFIYRNTKKMLNVLDREKLMLALRGQLREGNVKTAWLQEMPLGADNNYVSLHVQGLHTLTIPIPQQVHSFFLFDCINFY